MYTLSLVESFKSLAIYSTSVVPFLAYSSEYATLALTTSYPPLEPPQQQSRLRGEHYIELQ